VSRQPKSNDPRDCATLESAWQNFREAVPQVAHRMSFMAGAAWALGRISRHAENLIHKELEPSLKGEQHELERKRSRSHRRS